MRLFCRLIVLLLLAAPASAETDFDRFPFETEAGTYRDLIVYPAGGARALRLVFPSVRVERPSGDRATLRLGGEQRVIVQTSATGMGGFRTGAEVRFADAPLAMHRRKGRVEMAGSVEALSIALADTPDPAFGTIAFAGMKTTVSWPTEPSPDIQTAEMSLQARAMQVDTVFLDLPALANAHFIKTGPVDLRGRLGLRMPDAPVEAGQVTGAVVRAEIDRGSVMLLGGGVALSGAANIEPGPDASVTALEGTLSLLKFSTMIQKIMASGMVPPEHLLPFSMMAGGLGVLTPDGALTFAIETMRKGEVVVNGRPTAFRLSK